MTARPKSRVLAAAVFSILLAFEGHQLDAERHAMGKEAFLATQATDFDRYYAAKPPRGHLSRIGLCMGLAIPGIYEVLALGIYALIKPRKRNLDAQDTGA
jgi:hypothetical protein